MNKTANKTRRHSWEFSLRHFGQEIHTCRHCGLRRIRRWHVNVHWTEWRTATGQYIESAGAPPCADTLLIVPPAAAPVEP